MHISPKRRRRCLNIHHLSMQGHSQRQIAKRLEVSHATVRSDLQLIETHWADIAAPAADDLLLEQLHLIREQTARINEFNIMETFGKHMTISEYLKACDDRDARVLAYIREARRTIEAVHRRAGEREAQPDLYEDAETDTNPSETSTKSDITVQPESVSPQPELEIVASDPSQEKNPPETAQTDPDPLLDPIIQEAIALFPQLKGKPTEEILTFLDQLTDPANEQPLQTAAAG